MPRQHAKAELANRAQGEGESAPRVEVVAPKAMNSDHAIVLSGSVRPLEETVIYPRGNGYIANVDYSPGPMWDVLGSLPSP